MSRPTERVRDWQHTDMADLVPVTEAYELALSATEGDKVAAAILASTAVLVDQLQVSTETIRVGLLTAIEREDEERSRELFERLGG